MSRIHKCINEEKDQQMINTLLDLLFPIHSLHGREGMWVTEAECRRIGQSLQPVMLNKRELLKRGIRHLDALVAAGRYTAHPDLRRCIRTFKYHRIRAIGPILGSWLSKAIPGLLLSPPQYSNPQYSMADSSSPLPLLVPVPLHWTRFYSRGFNQAEILAQQVSKGTGWNIELLLKRTRPTGHQAWRKREDRLAALHNAFAYVEKFQTGAILKQRCKSLLGINICKSRPIQDRKPPPWIILIDDICTTGTTLNECAKVLKKAGVKHVSALVIAYG